MVRGKSVKFNFSPENLEKKLNDKSRETSGNLRIF